MHGRLKGPKTSSGKRKIQLPPKALLAFVDQHGNQGMDDFTFTDLKSGQRWASDQPSRKRAWIPAATEAGVNYWGATKRHIHMPHKYRASIKTYHDLHPR